MTISDWNKATSTPWMNRYTERRKQTIFLSLKADVRKACGLLQIIRVSMERSNYHCSAIYNSCTVYYTLSNRVLIHLLPRWFIMHVFITILELHQIAHLLRGTPGRPFIPSFRTMDEHVWTTHWHIILLIHVQIMEQKELLVIERCHGLWTVHVMACNGIYLTGLLLVLKWKVLRYITCLYSSAFWAAAIICMCSPSNSIFFSGVILALHNKQPPSKRHFCQIRTLKDLKREHETLDVHCTRGMGAEVWG